MLTLDPVDMLAESLTRRRAPSGNLYPSSDLTGPLRHAMLRAAGAPERPLPENIWESLMGNVRMETGTMWHDHFEELFRRQQTPVMLETNLKPYLVEGWSGRADWIMWSDEYRAFVLGDLKTIKAEGMGYIRKDGIKEAHMWQASAYWHALAKMGLPLVKAFVITYLPMSPLQGDEHLRPLTIEGTPLDRDLVWGRMVDRAAATKLYLAEVADFNAKFLARSSTQSPAPTEPTAVLRFINEHLAPVTPRNQALRWDSKKSIFDLKLLPDWSAMFCPYPAELCDCHTQGQTKLGHYEWCMDTEVTTYGMPTYVPRKGYEEIEPEVTLTTGQTKKLKEANDASGS